MKTENKWQGPGGDEAAEPDGGEGDAPKPDGD
jgi:hypothetical protein